MIDAKFMAALAERFDALTIRERLLVAVSVIAVGYTAWNSLVLSPLHVRHQALDRQLAAVSRQLTETEQELRRKTRAGDEGQGGLIQGEINHLRQAMAELDQQQSAAIIGFVRPREMVAMLKDLIGKLPELKLIRIQSFPARPLYAADGDKRPPVAFEHAVRIEFEGDYFGALKYFRKLEAMPRRFYWDFAGYEVKTYPLARIQVVIHTLSTSDAWLGV